MSSWREAGTYLNISQKLMEPEGSLTCSEEPVTINYPKPDQYRLFLNTRQNNKRFWTER
jgi:hypothetical protein